MAEKKRCIRCNRAIDPFARTCPFCNWDQSDLAAPRVEQSPEQTYAPPSENLWRKYVFMAVGGVILLVAAFALGSKIQGKKPVRGLEQQGQPSRTSTAPSRPAQRSDVTFVPVNTNDTVAVDQPITSAPATAQAQGVPPEYQRSDATAVSSVEYAQLAARADAEKKAKEKQQATVDPRSLRGPAYAQGDIPAHSQPQMSSSAEPAVAGSLAEPPPSPATEKHSEPARVVVSTRPVPEYQPIPDIKVSKTSTVRLELTVGADGRVHEVNVLQGIPGQTPRIISTVQTWRFRPATENGNPVSAPFTVDLSFRGQ
ncbi:MAG TPA: energy transducer TonB [Thermoanaerobaculia bacterium]